MAVREPCPGRIVDDTGGAFAMGCIGGSIYYMIRGALNSPKGERFRGGFWAIKYRAPVMGGSFAQWGAIFSFLDCGAYSIRGHESPFNAIFAGAGTSGFLAVGGIKGFLRGAFLGASILSVIEGLSYYYTQSAIKQQELMMRLMEKLNEERMRRQAAGLPDFQPEEMQLMMIEAMKTGELYFGTEAEKKEKLKKEGGRSVLIEDDDEQDD